MPRQQEQANERYLSGDIPDLTETERLAVELRLAGATYRKIGEQLGLHGSSAYDAVKRALRKNRGVDKTEELRQLELDRLDTVQIPLWKVIHTITSDFADVEKAIGRLIQLSKRRSELLGLDAPTSISVEGLVRARAIEANLDVGEVHDEVDRILKTQDLGG